MTCLARGGDVPVGAVPVRGDRDRDRDNALRRDPLKADLMDSMKTMAPRKVPASMQSARPGIFVRAPESWLH